MHWVVDGAVDRLSSQLGGKSYTGPALDSGGIVTEGTFVQLGPLLYFSGAQSGVIEESKAMQARIHTLDNQANAQIEAIAAQGSGLLPMDLSLGSALAIEAPATTVEHIEKAASGSIRSSPLPSSCIIAIVKFIQIMGIRQPTADTIHDIAQLLRDDQQAAALQIAEAQPEPARQMLVQAVRHHGEPLALVEESMYESMLTTQPRLERYLNVIAVTASVAPLLGLLGTVTGIIKTFNLMRVFAPVTPSPDLGNLGH